VHKRLTIAALLYVAWLFRASHVDAAAADDIAKHRVTVADTIRMTTLPENAHAAGDISTGRFARFSPDGKRFVVVTQKGDPETNDNEFSLLLFKTAEVFRHPVPIVLVSMRSHSNRDAIKNVRWMGNEKLYFIGEAHDAGQVYSVNAVTRALKRLTSHSTSVVDFDVDPKSEAVVYAAAPGPPDEKFALEKFNHGFAITIETPDSLPRTKAEFQEPDETQGEEVFVKYPGEKESAVVLADRYMPFKPISIAPDGRHAVIAVLLRDVPPSWIEYDDELIRGEVKAFRRKGSTSWLMRYMLLDLKSRIIKPLLPGPVAWSTGGAVWSSDGKSIAVSGAFLPLEVADPAEQEARKKHSFAVAMDVETGRFETITDKELVVTSWDARSNRLYFVLTSRAGAPVRIAYAMTSSGWTEESNPQDSPKTNLPDVMLEQDLNSSPKLYASDTGHPQKTLLLDLNLQFGELTFGKVEKVRWKASDGHEVEGGLYLPPDYHEGARYPLVIQTHGFSDKQFWINGPWNSAFAAQPLAAHGIVVLQVGHGTEPGEYMKHHRSLEEAPREMAAYEGAIDYLDSRGIVERGRVGIIGFSRTQYHVEYTLTHSAYHFEAATLADGFEGGYLEYLIDPYTEKDDVFVNGGPPFGENFSNWLDHSPSFRMDRIHLPVRVECYGGGVINCWEPFSVLTHLGRPVDLIYIPDGTHILVKPWERLTSQQGNVDWYRFWLKGEEDEVPQKREQYERWRAMRAIQERAGKDATPQ
jgi:dipeptidyl aminopeptidase/acylaminoacyl peptidase